MHLSRPFLLLIAAVVTVHGVLLAGVTAPEVRPAAGPVPLAFSTRTVVAQPALATATQADAAPLRVEPVRQRRVAQPLPAPAKQATVKRRKQPAPAATSTPPPPDIPASAALEPEQIVRQAELLALHEQEATTEQTPQAEHSSPAAEGSAQSPTAADAAAARGLASKTGEASASAAAPPVPLAPPDSDVKPEAAQPLTAPVPVKLPDSRRLGFDVTGKAKGFGYSARAELIWQHDATSYRAQQEVKVVFLGSRSQTSVGSITEWGLQPRRFGDKARSERAAHFDFAAGTVTFSANSPAAAIAPGAQDRLSVFLQLAGMLAAAPERYPRGTDIAMTTISARAADVWTFTVMGDETLELPIGTMVVVQLQRLPRRDYDQKAQVWLAPSLGYLPARIRITEANGDFAELNLRAEEAP